MCTLDSLSDHLGVVVFGALLSLPVYVRVTVCQFSNDRLFIAIFAVEEGEGFSGVQSFMWLCFYDFLFGVRVCVCVTRGAVSHVHLTFRLSSELQLPATLKLYSIISLFCPGLMSTLSAGSEMQTPALAPQFMVGPQGKVPGRKRGRPPIRKLEFQSHYIGPMLPLKVPKKRGRKPGFKVSKSSF